MKFSLLVTFDYVNDKNMVDNSKIEVKISFRYSSIN